jgi:valyl-tRNA synthetase
VQFVFSAGDATAQANAREVLYTCLDAGLRLLHPIMPFLTGTCNVAPTRGVRFALAAQQ